MTTPAISYTGPTVETSVPFDVRRHLQLIYQKLGNHTQAFALQQEKINAIKAGTSTTIEQGGSGGGGSVSPFVPNILSVNNQSGVTSYSTIAGDDAALIVLSDASPIAVSLTPQTPPFGCFIANQGAGTATLTPATIGAVTPTISYAGNPGAASMPLLGGYCTIVAFDGTEWWTWTDPIVPTSAGPTAHQWLASYNAATGVFGLSAPAIADVTGLSASLALLAPIANPTFTGTVTQPTPDVLTVAITTTSATAGAATALPVAPLGYLEMSVNGTTVKIPYYSV